MKTYLITALLFLSCCCRPILCDHNCSVEKAYPKLVPPIIVIGEQNSWAGHSVIVRDSRDSTLLMGNMSSRGNIIGNSYNVGDTIK